MTTRSIAAEQPQVQRHVGPTPFASARVAVNDGDVHLLARVDGRASRQSQSVKVNFNVPAASKGAVTSTLWSHPPPSRPLHGGDALPPVGPNGVPILPKDTLHPLISALQAAENAKAASFNPAVAYSSNASRTAPPCDAHVALARRGQNTRESHQAGAGDGADGDGSDAEKEEGEEDDEEAHTSARSRGPARGAHSRRGDIKTAIGRAYNAEGAFHEPEQYTTHIITVATTQPTTATAIAAKALGKALHEGSSLAIPANAFAAPNTMPSPNSSVHGRSANRHLFDGLNANPHGAMPPSAAFRALPDRLKGILLNRPHDTRLTLETAVLDLRAEQGGTLTSDVDPEKAASGNLPPKNHQAVPNTAISAITIDVDELLLRSGSLDVWSDAVRRCASRNFVPDRPLPPSHPMMQSGVAFRQLKAVAHTPASLYASQATHPGAQMFLGGCGLRVEDALTQVKLPSQASFLTDPSRARNVKQYTNIPFTPSNAYGFDSERFHTLLSETGLEVEHIELEGAKHISTLEDIARFCPNVKLLHLGGCDQLTLPVLEDITKSCKLLSCLNLSAVDLAPEAVHTILGNTQDLMTLVLSGNARLDSRADAGFLQLHRHRRLRVLDVSYCPELTDAVLISAAQYCPGLEVIDVTGCFKVSDVGVGSIGASCPLLKVWRLGLCATVTATGLMGVATATRHLEVLDLTGCTQLTNSSVKEIARRLTSLVMLSLAGCTLITDEAIQSVARQCRRLQILNLSSCTKVSMLGCMELIHELTNLSLLIASESSISNAEVVMLSSLRETCKIIRNQFRPVPLPTLIGYRSAEVAKKPAPKKGEKKK